MKKQLMVTLAATLMAGAALADGHAKQVKLGIILGFTGPLESITPGMAAGAEQAMREVNASGLLLDNATVLPVLGDSTCVDAAAATAAAERLVAADGVNGIMGADCSGATGAILANVAMPNGVAIISPASTSPALTEAEDNGMFFRTVPSDARQGQILADVLIERGYKQAAITYTNNDYGKGLAPRALARPFARRAAPSPRARPTSMARPIIPPRWARWPRPGARSWSWPGMWIKAAPA